MDFAKKMKTRFYTAVGYTVFGVLLIVGAAVSGTENEFISAFGAAMVVCGLVRLKRHFAVTKNEETMRAQEIRETDERNIMLTHRARSAAFAWYVVLCGAVTIVLSLLGQHDAAKWTGLSMCAPVALFWLCWFVLRRKN